MSDYVTTDEMNATLAEVNEALFEEINGATIDPVEDPNALRTREKVSIMSDEIGEAQADIYQTAHECEEIVTNGICVKRLPFDLLRKLQWIKEQKAALKTAIQGLGTGMPDNEIFHDYYKWIGAGPGPTPEEITPGPTNPAPDPDFTRVTMDMGASWRIDYEIGAQDMRIQGAQSVSVNMQDITVNLFKRKIKPIFDGLSSGRFEVYNRYGSLHASTRVYYEYERYTNGSWVNMEASYAGRVGISSISFAFTEHPAVNPATDSTVRNVFIKKCEIYYNGTEPTGDIAGEFECNVEYNPGQYKYGLEFMNPYDWTSICHVKIYLDNVLYCDIPDPGQYPVSSPSGPSPLYSLESFVTRSLCSFFQYSVGSQNTYYYPEHYYINGTYGSGFLGHPVLELRVSGSDTQTNTFDILGSRPLYDFLPTDTYCVNENGVPGTMSSQGGQLQPVSGYISGGGLAVHEDDNYNNKLESLIAPKVDFLVYNIDPNGSDPYCTFDYYETREEIPAGTPDIYIIQQGVDARGIPYPYEFAVIHPRRIPERVYAVIYPDGVTRQEVEIPFEIVRAQCANDAYYNIPHTAFNLAVDIHTEFLVKITEYLSCNLVRAAGVTQITPAFVGDMTSGRVSSWDTPNTPEADSVTRSSQEAETEAEQQTGQPATDVATKILAYAVNKIGTPYPPTAEQNAGNRFGPTYYDCSGLVYKAVQAGGISIPTVSAEQYGYYRSRGGLFTSRASLRPGDLVFWSKKSSGSRSDGYGSSNYVHHVGLIYSVSGSTILIIDSGSKGVQKRNLWDGSGWVIEAFAHPES